MTGGRVLIVGAGIAGLTAAAALRQHGVSAQVVERSPHWPDGGAGIVLHANAVRILGTLGLADAVNRASAPVPRWRFCTEDGQALCETDLDQLWAEVAQCRGISRRALHQILRTAAGPVPCRLGVAATDLAQHDDHVSVTFSDGSHGDYQLVLGADGIRSTIRRLAISAVAPTYAGLMSWRGLARMRPQAPDLAIYMGDGRFFGLAPAGDGQTYGFAGVQGECLDDPVAGRLSRLQALFATFGEPVRGYLDALGSDADLHVAPVEWVDGAPWRDGRVLLIGDAAHASTPHMGQGGAMAMEDAVVLAEVLRSAGYIGAGDAITALKEYTARRHGRVAWVQEQSRLAATAWLLPPATRDLALRQHGDRMLRERFGPLIPRP